MRTLSTQAAEDKGDGTDAPLLIASGLYKSYGAGKDVLSGVDLTVDEGETVGLVGRSGAGKSTLGRIVAGLELPDAGRLTVLGRDLTGLRGRARREALLPVQTIFQDPYEALSPAMTIEQLVAEPLVIRRRCRPRSPEARELVRQALAEVSLPEHYMRRYPHELSGGERQRVGLARAFIIRPRLIVADEPTSMLDPSLRLELLSLMKQLQRRHGITYLFITHDIALTRSFCDRLLVLDGGGIVEVGRPSELIGQPRHPFTQQLVGALKELHRF